MEIIISFVVAFAIIIWICVKFKDNGEQYQDYNNIPVQQGYYQPPRNAITCKKCGGWNIQISMQTIPISTSRKTEVRRKSAVDRAANKTGRGLANLMTLGAYGLFVPKRSDYMEVGGDSFNYVQKKICICQTCGNSWKI